MIKGEKKKQLNDIELDINEIIGDHTFGTKHYFDLLYDTFLRSKRHLELDSEHSLNDLMNEDDEVKASILTSYAGTAYPILETLYSSYFITLHSEFDLICQEIFRLYNLPENQHNPKLTSHKFFASIANFNSSKMFERNQFIFKAIQNHSILQTYNYIRNGIIHAKNNKTSPDFLNLEKCLANGNIVALEIVDKFNDHEIIPNQNEHIKNEFVFSIKSLEFGSNYAIEILNFLHDLVEIAK